MHPGQLTVTVATVRALIDCQFPQWRALEIEPVKSAGTVNTLFRVGPRLCARFPLEDGLRQRLIDEAEAAQKLCGKTRFDTPKHVAIGEPGPGYAFPWSVQTWIPGTVATGEDSESTPELARDLAYFIRDVQAIDPCGAVFDGNGRGGDLKSHDEWLHHCFTQSIHLLNVPRLRRIWSSLRTLPRRDPDLMTHGDLIPGNILLRSGRLGGVIDVGGLGPADPSIDLVCAWHLFDEGSRATLREELGCDEIHWQRGKAWAFQQAMGLVWYYVDSNPTMSALGRRTLDRILADGG